MKHSNLYTVLFALAFFALLLFHFICEHASAQQFTSAALQTARAWDYAFLSLVYSIWGLLFAKHLKRLHSSNFYN